MCGTGLTVRASLAAGCLCWLAALLAALLPTALAGAAQYGWDPHMGNSEH